MRLNRTYRHWMKIFWRKIKKLFQWKIFIYRHKIDSSSRILIAYGFRKHTSLHNWNFAIDRITVEIHARLLCKYGKRTHKKSVSYEFQKIDRRNKSKERSDGCLFKSGHVKSIAFEVDRAIDHKRRSLLHNDDWSTRWTWSMASKILRLARSNNNNPAD